VNVGVTITGADGMKPDFDQVYRFPPERLDLESAEDADAAPANTGRAGLFGDPAGAGPYGERF
jgi:hypothetical protein